MNSANQPASPTSTPTDLRAPSIARALRGLAPTYQALVEERYSRLLPVLLLLMRPSDIASRNRTWPGSSPERRVATGYLSATNSRQVKRTILAYAVQTGKNFDELWALFRAYCRYGPIGLIEALPSQFPPLVDDIIQEYVDLHRLARHPRADAGVYIRSLLNQYTNDLGSNPLPPFVARYAWASDRRLERWYVGDSPTTEHVSRTTRRVVLGQPYPHQCWQAHVAQLPFVCRRSRRQPVVVKPWIIWICDEHTGTLMGYRVCDAEPGGCDLALTLRWSIWHHGASWWPARGIPDTLVVPAQLISIGPDVKRALSYLYINLHAAPARIEPPASNSYVGWPESFAAWLVHLQQRSERLSTDSQWTIAELNDLLRDYIEEAMLQGVATRTTPTALQEQDCSLPWSTGIGAVLLMPSAGTVPVSSNRIAVWEVPYDVDTALPDDTMVDVRYDPDDARQVYVVQGAAQVCVAPANAFEHRTSWAELVESHA